MTAIYMAPMEEITTHIYRRVMHHHFREPDKYFTPYLSPSSGDTLLTEREWQEIRSIPDSGIPVIPQLMVNQLELCLRAIEELSSLGIREVNLNLGCPSGNVVRKGKGAGMLRDPDQLAHFLDRIYTHSPIRVSLKTRLGLQTPEEFHEILNVLCRFPIYELILHPRIRQEFYTGPLHEEFYEDALTRLSCPIIANGEICARQDIARIQEEFPQIHGVMIGRGWITDPALLNDLRPLPDQYLDFYQELEEEYRRILPHEYAVLVKMKRIWHYRQFAYNLNREEQIHILSSKNLREFHEKITRILASTSYSC